MFSEYQLFMYSHKKLVYISNCIFHVSFRIFSTLKLRFALEKRCSYSFLIRRTHMLHPKLDSPNLWRRLRSISIIKFNLDKIKIQKDQVIRLMGFTLSRSIASGLSQLEGKRFGLSNVFRVSSLNGLAHNCCLAHRQYLALWARRIPPYWSSLKAGKMMDLA